MYKRQEDIEKDELMWVKAGGPGEKPTIIRQVRSESSSYSSRDNSGDSSNGIKQNSLLNTGATLTSRVPSNDSMHNFEQLGKTSSDDSRVIVVNVAESTYPFSIDKEKVKRWKISQGICATSREAKVALVNNDKNSLIDNEIKSTVYSFKNISVNNNKEGSQSPICQLKSKSKSQPVDLVPHFSPLTEIKRSASEDSPKRSDSLNQERNKKIGDEGYTTLLKDPINANISDSLRSKTLPSSWRPAYLKEQHSDFLKFSKRMASEQESFVQCCKVPTEETNSQIDRKRKEKRKRFRHHFENAIEIGTCFVCLRSAVYHIQDEDDTDSFVDHPCKCESCSSNSCSRWGVITLMVCFLPLLIFYPPIKACLTIHDSRVQRKKRNKKKKESMKKLVSTSNS